MKPAYRASSMCRKTLTTEIQSGASNVSTSDSSPYSLSEPQPARKTQRICPMEQYNLAKCAALSPFDCCRISLKKKNAYTTIVVEAGTLPLDVIGRPAIFTGMRPGLPWPLRGFDGDVGWKASRCAISWAPAGRCRRSRGGMAFQDLVNREASPSFCSSAAGSTLFPYPFPECPDSWIAPGVGRRDEAAPRGCFDLPVEQRDQRAPFHLPRDHPRVSHSRPHALDGGVDHHAVESEARGPREVR